MEIEDWLTAMEAAASDDVSKDVNKEYKTPETSPRKEEQTGPPANSFDTTPFVQKSSFSTPPLTPGPTPGKLDVVVKGDTS